MFSFKNKIILITGAASGIGRLMAEKSLKRDAGHVILWDIDEDALEHCAQDFTSHGFSVTPMKVDVSNAMEVSEAAKQVKKKGLSPDVLINNAGVVVGKSFVEHEMEEISKTMGVNSLGLMFTARAFLPMMEEKPKAFIVNIASAAGLTPNPWMTVYAGSKWAATGWSESLRLELEESESSVKIVTVMPGYIDTGMFEGVSEPLFLPLLKPDDITEKILKAVEKEKNRLREPFLVKCTPFIRGILPAPVYDFVAGKLFGVYSSMKTFKGRN